MQITKKYVDEFIEGLINVHAELITCYRLHLETFGNDNMFSYGDIHIGKVRRHSSPDGDILYDLRGDVDFVDSMVLIVISVNMLDKEFAGSIEDGEINFAHEYINIYTWYVPPDIFLRYSDKEILVEAILDGLFSVGIVVPTRMQVVEENAPISDGGDG